MYRSPTTENLGNRDFDLSMSLKVKCGRAFGLPIYGFLLKCNANMLVNSVPLQDIRLMTYIVLSDY